MAKKKTPARPRTTSMPPRLIEALEEIEELVQRQRWDEALDVLEELEERYPNHPAVLTYLVNVSQQTE